METNGQSPTKLVTMVTGASSGIGKEIVKQLLVDGYVVFAAARRIERMADLKQLGAIPLKMDISNASDISKAISTIHQTHAGIDVLVNNAGFGLYGAVEDTSLEDARYQFEVNVFGLAHLTQEVLPHMRNKRFGRIVNISSIIGKIYCPLGSWYCASKHALEGWSDCLRIELAPFGIDVVLVEPGIIQTEFGSTALGPMQERSGKSAYAHMTQLLAVAMEKSYRQNKRSHPSVVARTISKALKSKKPKTRYAVGQMAKPLLFARRWISDRIFDKLIMMQLKKKGSG